MFSGRRVPLSDEGNEEVKRITKEMKAGFGNKEASQKRMISQLEECDLSEWEENFVTSCAGRLQVVGILTEKQDAKLTELFERY